MLELDDMVASAHRDSAVGRGVEMLKEGFDVMYQDGKQLLKIGEELIG